MEPQIGPKGPRPLGGFGSAEKASSKHHFSRHSKLHHTTQKPFLTNHFHGFTSHGPGHHRLGAGHAETQQSKRPFSFAKSESFPRQQLAKTPATDTTQAFPRHQQKLMWNLVKLAEPQQQQKTSKRLKSLVGSGSSYLPPPPSSTLHQMPNQSKISLPQATAGGSGTTSSSFPKFQQQSLEDTEVSTKYNNVAGDLPSFQTKNSIIKGGNGRDHHFHSLPG